MEFTNNGVGFEWELAGPGGAAFYMRPLRGKHTHDDLVKAKEQIRRDHDVVHISTEWVDSYGGQLFKHHREYVIYLQGLKQQLIKKLTKPENVAKFKGMTISGQRYMIWQLMDAGLFKFTIRPR